MHNREPTLPINVKYSLVGIERNGSEHSFDKETFDAVLTTAISMRANIHQTACENIFWHKKNNAVIVFDGIKCLIRLKWVKKCFYRIKEGWTEKVANFNFHGVAHSQFIRYKIRTLRTKMEH